MAPNMAIAIAIAIVMGSPPIDAQSLSPDEDKMTRILFVCLGNICRSPTAEGVFSSRAQAAALDVVTDSAGTGGWHIGHPPDHRAIRAAAGRGYDISGLRARQVTQGDFHKFDLILAMDRQNLHDLRRMAPIDGHARLSLFLDRLELPDVAGAVEAADQREVPDPYYSGGFDHVLDLIEQGADRWIRHLQDR